MWPGAPIFCVAKSHPLCKCAYSEEGVIYGMVVYQESIVAKCNPVYVQCFIQDYFCHFYPDIPRGSSLAGSMYPMPFPVP